MALYWISVIDFDLSALNDLPESLLSTQPESASQPLTVNPSSAGQSAYLTTLLTSPNNAPAAPLQNGGGIMSPNSAYMSTSMSQPQPVTYNNSVQQQVNMQNQMRPNINQNMQQATLRPTAMQQQIQHSIVSLVYTFKKCFVCVTKSNILFRSLKWLHTYLYTTAQV